MKTADRLAHHRTALRYFLSRNIRNKNILNQKSKVNLFTSGFKSNPNSGEFNYAHTA